MSLNGRFNRPALSAYHDGKGTANLQFWILDFDTSVATDEVIGLDRHDLLI